MLTNIKIKQKKILGLEEMRVARLSSIRPCVSQITKNKVKYHIKFLII